MRLLVSAANVADARAALGGGADIIDAKDPSRGALGPVGPSLLRAMRDVVPCAVSFSAALGDAATEREVERETRAVAAVGVSYVKIGLLGVMSERRAQRLIAAAVRGANAGSSDQLSALCSIIAVVYADMNGRDAIPFEDFIPVAAHAGAAGVLLDTADKGGRGLLAHMSLSRIGDWISAARANSLLTAVAGKLTGEDVPIVRALDPDVIGVRGAACDGGRTGRISTERVRDLAFLVTVQAPW